MKRDELEQDLKVILSPLKTKRKIIKTISEDLLERKIPDGVTKKFFKQPDSVSEADIKMLYLLAKSLKENGVASGLDLEDYFTKSEMKQCEGFTGDQAMIHAKEMLPLTVPNAQMISHNVYIGKLSAKQIYELMQAKTLNYNPETQREGVYKKQKDTVIQVPKVYKKSVKQISEHLQNGTLKPTTLVYNAAVRTSDIGDELIYDDKHHTLTITEGTRLDVLDGFHRTLGVNDAVLKNPDIDFSFPVMFTNYTVPEAQQYIGQMAQANPISKARANELSQSTLAHRVIHELRNRSELRSRISQTEIVSKLNKELVSVSVLANEIDNEFKMNNTRDALDVADYLVDFFNYLLTYYYEIFTDKYDEYRKTSLMNRNLMFAGYVILASKLYKEGKNVAEVKHVLNEIDFNKTNPLWAELEIFEGNAFKRNAIKNIRKYFKEL